ncbi:T9SS type A sorting domain-containing protein [Dyadobacter sp. 3J3]|uniref:T9SS type A sorting domain-containing protein n=1 Tax=Dyadobacter sp. 3J3 TaxID=2606600 RepID=UPI00135768F8|nr:T9SS type A sorting domain-containing protein [Dyadobacter sp. 3J3]
MMKDFVINLCRVLYLVFAISPFGVYAQTFSHSVMKIPEWKTNLVKLIKLPVQEKLEEIRARSTPEYYAKLYGVNGILAKREGVVLRTAEICGKYVCSVTPLPVNLISFKGERIDASRVGLTWETSSETNNAGFEIERSLTGTIDFEKVGFVDGGGTVAKNKTYAFSDLFSNENVTYYRLKQLDYDGSFEYSRIIAVNGFRELLTFITIPNPGTQNNTFFQIAGNDASGEIDLTILDSKGQVLYKNNRLKVRNDKQIALGRLPKLTAGLYIAKIICAGQQSTASFVIRE